MFTIHYITSLSVFEFRFKSNPFKFPSSPRKFSKYSEAISVARKAGFTISKNGTLKKS